MEAFASQLRLVMAEEEMAMSTIGHADLSPGHGPRAMPALQDAYQHLDKAAYLATGAGASPYGDVGTSLMDLISDEQTTIQQMLGDYGDPSEQSDYRRIREDHQRLLTMLRELQQRGY